MFTDLINFANANGDGTLEPQRSPVNDWLGGPVPDGVPQPHIKPDLTSSMPVGDLISFTEFDTEHFLTGLSEVRQRQERIQSISCEADRISDISDREDIEVATINSMSNDMSSQYYMENKERSISDPGHLEALLKNALPNCIDTSTDYSTPEMVKHDVRISKKTEGEILQDRRQIPKHNGEDYSVPQKAGNGLSKLSQSKGMSGHAPIRVCLATTESTPKQTAGAIKEMKEKKSSAPKVRLAVNFSLVSKK